MRRHVQLASQCQPKTWIFGRDQKFVPASSACFCPFRKIEVHWPLVHTQYGSVSWSGDHTFHFLEGRRIESFPSLVGPSPLLEAHPMKGCGNEYCQGGLQRKMCCPLQSPELDRRQ